MDSDKAMAAAESAGYKPASDADFTLSKGAGGSAIWKIGAFEIDALTGKPVK